LAGADPRTLPQDFDPVFVGIVWPSTALTILGENAPAIAAEAASTAELAAVLAGDDRAAALLATKPGKLDQSEAIELASLLVAGIDDDPDEEVVAIEPGDLIAAASAIQEAMMPAAAQPGSFDDFGHAAAPAAEAQAAGLLGYLDPRWIVRVATVLSMKSRAGIVGRGVAELVDRILQLDMPRLILTGHSYGAKVVMSALAVTAPKRAAHAAALLQPAVSRLCFAADIGDGRSGGFRANLNRVQLPILSTYSHRDLPLYRLFHLVARRKEDLGEVQLAAESRFAALGGYGPEGCMPGEVVIEHFAPSPSNYTWPRLPARIVAFDGTDAISGHGDVANDRVLSAVLGLLR
jgi:hypothetical protein